MRGFLCMGYSHGHGVSTRVTRPVMRRSSSPRGGALGAPAPRGRPSRERASAPSTRARWPAPRWRRATRRPGRRRRGEMRAFHEREGVDKHLVQHVFTRGAADKRVCQQGCPTLCAIVLHTCLPSQRHGVRAFRVTSSGPWSGPRRRGSGAAVRCSDDTAPWPPGSAACRCAPRHHAPV